MQGPVWPLEQNVDPLDDLKPLVNAVEVRLLQTLVGLLGSYDSCVLSVVPEHLVC